MKFQVRLISLDFKPIIFLTNSNCARPLEDPPLVVALAGRTGHLQRLQAKAGQRSQGKRDSMATFGNCRLDMTRWQMVSQMVDNLIYLTTLTPDSLSRSTKHAKTMCHSAMGVPSDP
jgi:hypothetical protein